MLAPLAELQLADGAVLLPGGAWSNEQLVPLLADLAASNSAGNELPMPLDQNDGALLLCLTRSSLSPVSPGPSWRSPPPLAGRPRSL